MSEAMKLSTRSPLSLPVAALLFLLPGCVLDGQTTTPSANFDVTIDEELPVAHSTGQGILRLVNDPGTGVEFLTGEAELDLRAAEGIVAHRSGPDGTDGSGDDDLFDDLFELDALPYVDTLALVRLGEIAWDLDLVPVLELEGVPFSEAELNHTILLVNFASFAELDSGASLDIRAAEALVHGRPYESLVDVALRPFVGPSSLEQMRDYAPLWLSGHGSGSN